MLEYTCGATNALDLYSAYLTPDQLAEVYSQIEGNFVGLGIELKADRGALLIVNVIGGGPAANGGLKAGDRIIGVNGVAATGGFELALMCDITIAADNARLSSRRAGSNPRRPW